MLSHVKWYILESEWLIIWVYLYIYLIIIITCFRHNKQDEKQKIFIWETTGDGRRKNLRCTHLNLFCLPLTLSLFPFFSFFCLFSIMHGTSNWLNELIADWIEAHKSGTCFLPFFPQIQTEFLSLDIWIHGILEFGVVTLELFDKIKTKIGTKMRAQINR